MRFSGSLLFLHRTSKIDVQHYKNNFPERMLVHKIKYLLFLICITVTVIVAQNNASTSPVYFETCSNESIGTAVNYI